MTTCPNLFQSDAGGPAPVKPIPSPEQASDQHTEMTAFIHFSLATFDGTEQGHTAEKPTVFAPTNLTQDTGYRYGASVHQRWGFVTVRLWFNVDVAPAAALLAGVVLLATTAPPASRISVVSVTDFQVALSQEPAQQRRAHRAGWRRRFAAWPKTNINRIRNVHLPDCGTPVSGRHGGPVHAADGCPGNCLGSERSGNAKGARPAGLAPKGSSRARRISSP